eukprot:maker-scaffold_153-snap-gene-0.4-mRNA-1 protein AED:0.44 eAED:0.51 QI:0/0/0/0.66/0/0/3/0/110
MKTSLINAFANFTSDILIRIPTSVPINHYPTFQTVYTKFGETFAGLSTTSFLTATTLIYATGAGITAAAGTRLALQLFLAKNFIFSPFQSQNQKVLYCYFLSLPPRIRIG